MRIAGLAALVLLAACRSAPTPEVPALHQREEHALVFAGHRSFSSAELRAVVLQELARGKPDSLSKADIDDAAFARLLDVRRAELPGFILRALRP